MMTPEQAAVCEARERLSAELGRAPTDREGGDYLGISEMAFRRRRQRAQKWIDAPEGVKSALTATGLDLRSASHGWRVIPREDGGRESVFWKNETTPEDFAQAIKDALSDIPALPAIERPNLTESDLLTLYPIADLHLGMMAWGRETGEAYDTDAAADRLVSWIMRAVAASPASDTAVILSLGDTLHANDQTNATPKSKHVLDVDTRHHRTLDTAIKAMAIAIEAAAAKHARVKVKILAGNHDPESSMAVMFALRERYRLSSTIHVDDAPGEFFIHQFGKVMLAAHHGDKAKADRLAHFIADEFAPIWGKTRYRYAFTGHLHHHKAQDIGGIAWEQLQAVTARDAYAYSHAYSARASLSAITYHRDKGEVSRVRISH